ncbi:hypothetical protein ALQ56_102732 [Pseudomonas syringae pv. papulans]|nr:hypothetical protein ALQ56_102732 [Pseudomonas syringae pv. papulans]
MSLANDCLLHGRVARSTGIDEVLSIFKPGDLRIARSSVTV